MCELSLKMSFYPSEVGVQSGAKRVLEAAERLRPVLQHHTSFMVNNRDDGPDFFVFSFKEILLCS